MSPQEIGREIREERKRQKMTQVYLSVKSGWAFQTIQQAEYGRRATLRLICDLAEALGLEIIIRKKEKGNEGK